MMVREELCKETWVRNHHGLPKMDTNKMFQGIKTKAKTSITGL